MPLKINEVIIVEGKYDKIKLSSFLDATIIVTNGFGIFKDKEQLKLIRRLANERGIIILTDSDSAGFKIRSYIGGSVPKEKIKHVYIPDVFGKERRKNNPSAEGKLGVEGLDKDIILKALQQAGVGVFETGEHLKKITKYDFYEAGFSGKPDSAQKRKKLKTDFNLPERLSTNGLLDVLNILISYDDWTKYINKE
jgi:ribonuclease M5